MNGLNPSEHTRDGDVTNIVGEVLIVGLITEYESHLLEKTHHFGDVSYGYNDVGLAGRPQIGGPELGDDLKRFNRVTVLMGSLLANYLLGRVQNRPRADVCCSHVQISKEFWRSHRP